MPVNMVWEEHSYKTAKPIVFTSMSITDVETCYANIEWECLSVVFGLGKFHTYIYGKHITVYNDYKPLEMIMKKPMHTAALQFQWMLLRLQHYDHTLQYNPGKEMVLADRLNRFPSRKLTNWTTSTYPTFPIHTRWDQYHTWSSLKEPYAQCSLSPYIEWMA